MINVAITLAANSLALNGAALYASRFEKFTEKYITNDIHIEICDCHRMFNDATEYTKTKKFSRRQKIKRILNTTYIGNCVYVYLMMIKHAKEAVLNHKNTLENANLIIANDIQTAYYAKRYFPSKPLIFIMHNNGNLYRMLYIQFPKLQKGFIRQWMDKIANFVFNKAEKIVFVSETARQSFICQHPETELKSYFMPQCIEDANYISEKDYTNLNLICVGTVAYRKNQISILEALYDIEKSEDFSRKYPNQKITLSIIGDGEDLQKCKNFAYTNNLSNVIFYGSQSDVSTYLNQANCFIFPSLDEGLPTVAIEAMRAGLPLILSDVGGCRELIDKNGILLNNGSINEIIRGIQFMIEKKSEMKLMAKKSRKMYDENYTIENMINKYSELIKETVKMN